MKKNKLNLREEYQKSWDYIRESRNFIYLIIGVFFLFVLAGYFLPVSTEIENLIMEFIKNLLEQTKNMSYSELSSFIFLNNLESSFFGLIFGFFLGIFPVLVAVFNGYILGFVVEKGVEGGGIFVLWRLLPHGIFELTAVFISLGMGVKFGTFLFQKKKVESFRKYLWNS